MNKWSRRFFFDKIVCIDDYKPEFSPSRKDYFNEIQFIKPSVFDYDYFVRKASEVTEKFIPKIQSGEIESAEFKKYFDHLKIPMIFTWDISSSVFYLTQKILGNEIGIDIEKYGILTSALYSEGYNINKIGIEDDLQRFELYDKSGLIDIKKHKLISKEGHNVDAKLSKQFEFFIAGLNWLSLRTTIYLLLGEYFQSEVFLHPIRQGFSANLLSTLYSVPYGKLLPIISAMNNETHTAISQVKGLYEPALLSNKIPLFSAYLVEKTNDPSKVFESAYELRQRQEFVDARNKLREFSLLIENGDNQKFVLEGNKLATEITNLMKEITAKFGVGHRQGISTSVFTKVWNFSTILSKFPKVPNINYEIKGLAFLKDIILVKGFKAVYKNLAHDLLSISRLGKYHELLSSKVRFHRDAVRFNPKVEDPKFRYAKSWWKIPM